MGGARCKEIEEEIGVIEDELHGHDQKALKRVGLRDFNEGHEMHALILGFIKKGPYPAFIISHFTKRRQMLPKPADHTGDGSNGF